MTGLDYCASPVLRARLNGRAAKIQNRETREDAVQEAFADILALSPITLEDAIDTGYRAIDRIRKQDRRYLERNLPPIVDDAAPSPA